MYIHTWVYNIELYIVVRYSTIDSHMYVAISTLHLSGIDGGTFFSSTGDGLGFLKRNIAMPREALTGVHVHNAVTPKP